MASLLRNYYDDEEALGKRVEGLFRSWMHLIQQNYHRKWLYYERLYWGYRPPSPVDPNRSNVHLPLVQTAIDTALPRIMQSLWATEPPFHADPRSPRVDALVRGEIVENLIWRDWRKSNRWASLEMALKDALKLGIGFEKIMWNLDLDVDGIPLHDGVEFQRIRPMDLAWNPKETRFEDTPIIHWKAMRYSDLEEMKNSGAKLQNMDEVGEAGQADQSRAYTLNDLYTRLGMTGPLFRNDMDDNYSPSPGNAKSDGWVVVLEYWDDEITCMVDGGSGKVLLKPRRNKQRTKPFQCWRCNPTGDFLVGKGFIETLAGIQEATNNYENAWLDNAILRTYKMFFFDKSTNLKQNDFIPMPNKAIGVKLGGGQKIKDVVQPYDDNPLPQDGRDAQEGLMLWYERAVGQGTLTQGSSAQRQDTYGGQALQIREASMRLFLDNTRWGDELARGARIHFLMLKYYMQDYQEIGVTGRNVPLELVEENFFPEFHDINGHPQIQVGPGLFAGVADGAFEFLPTGSQSAALKEHIQDQIMQLTGELMQDPYVGAQPVPMADPTNVMLAMELRLREIAASEITGKKKLVQMITEAYMAAAQRYQAAMEAQQQAAPAQEGAPAQAAPGPEGAPAQGMGQMITPDEQEAPPPPPPPQPQVMQ